MGFIIAVLDTSWSWVEFDFSSWGAKQRMIQLMGGGAKLRLIKYILCLAKARVYKYINFSMIGGLAPLAPNKIIMGA